MNSDDVLARWRWRWPFLGDEPPISHPIPTSMSCINPTWRTRHDHVGSESRIWSGSLLQHRVPFSLACCAVLALWPFVSPSCAGRRSQHSLIPCAVTPWLCESPSPCPCLPDPSRAMQLYSGRGVRLCAGTLHLAMVLRSHARESAPNDTSTCSQAVFGDDTPCSLLSREPCIQVSAVLRRRPATSPR